MFLKQEKKKWVLSKNGLRIAVGRLVELLEKMFLTQEKKKWVPSKNGLRIAVGRLVFLRQAKKNGYFPKMVLELL